MTTSFGPFRLAHHSHPGPRESNQDTVLSIRLPDHRWLLAVADGMGGLEEGELASKTALSALYRGLSRGLELEEAVREGNRAVNREAKGRDMGTTLVAAVISGRRAEFVNVGDSRAYCSDPLGLVQVTRDHTLAEEARRSGDPEAASLNTESNRWAAALARYLGAREDVEADRFGPLELTEGAWLLLSTDGLHDVMSLDEIDRFLRTRTDPQEAALGLVEEALGRGTGDNVSVALAVWPRPQPGFVPPSPSPREEPVEGRSRILIPTGRRPRPRKRVGRVVTLFLTIAVLAIALVFLVDWIRSAGP